MKTMKIAAAAWLAGWAGLAAGAAAVVQVDGPKKGNWTVYYFEKAANTETANSKDFCIQRKKDSDTNGTWVTGTTLFGSGRWNADGNDVYFYGTLPDSSGQDAAFSAFGQTTGEKLVTGHYLKQTPSNTTYGTFKAVFQKVKCP